MKSVFFAAILALSVSLSSSSAFAGLFYVCTADTETGAQKAYLKVSDTGAVSFSLGNGVLKVLTPNSLSPNKFSLDENSLAYINVPTEMLTIPNPAQGGTIGKFEGNKLEIEFNCGQTD